jgi:hypothetical protein
MPARRLCATAFVLALALPACTSDPFPPLHPLTGTVTRDGKPVEGGGLIFIPGSGGGLVVNASVGKDGRFAAQTEHTGKSGLVIRPGAPAGKYKVIYHPPSDGSKMNLEFKFDEVVVVDGKPTEIALVLPVKMPEGTGAERDEKKKDK